MSVRLLFLSAVSTALLCACSTVQENPNYQYSTKYKAAVPSQLAAIHQSETVQAAAPVSYQVSTYETASVPTYTRVNHDCLRQEKNRELIGAGVGGTIGAIAGKKIIGGTKGTIIGAGVGGVAGYGLGDKSIDCDPIPVTATRSEPVVSQAYQSPTDTQFESLSDEGTPGYQVMQAQAVEYDYSQNIVTAPESAVAVPTAAATIAPVQDRQILPTPEAIGQSHFVRQGDTVYSLSRKLCVDIEDIQSLNGLNSSYAINIGDSLRLPASRCLP